MASICYDSSIRFRGERRELLDIAVDVIDEYVAEGYVLTLRQLYYRLVARGVIPNTVQSYKRLGDIINKGRLAGEVDWDTIEDRTRNAVALPHWDSPAEIIETAADQFRIDKWEGQKRRVEVWVEKEALAGVFIPVCKELDVTFFACRGYVSQSEMHSAARRLAAYREAGAEPVILHFGDHDPSGIDMTRDIADRQELFAGVGLSHVHRIALNMAQVEQYGPPPNPAKVTDSRFDGYLMRYGSSSWELDALSPQVLSKLVRDTVLEFRDEDLFAEMATLETQQRERLQVIAHDTNWL